MTTDNKRSVVADDVLGNLARKIHDLLRRVLEGSVAPNLASNIIQLALEGPPSVPDGGGSSYGIYILESTWCWDNDHTEYATICLEKCDSPIPFEDILNPKANTSDKAGLLEWLKRIHDAQEHGHGSHNMVRLYRLMKTKRINYGQSIGLENTQAIGVYFILSPICNFDNKNEPIPCAK